MGVIAMRYLKKENMTPSKKQYPRIRQHQQKWLMNKIIELHLRKLIFSSYY